MAGAFGPLQAAVRLTAWQCGRASLRELWARLTHWRIGPGWFLVAWLSPVVVFLLVVSGQVLLSGSWSELWRFGLVEELPTLSGFTGCLVWILTFGLGEGTAQMGVC
jgi:hypothetical protein